MWNLPNSLTIARIFMVPVLVVVLLTEFPDREFWGLGIFLLAALTDLLDGIIARRTKRITVTGALLDPIADKLLISAAFISLVELGLAPAWMVFLIVGREFAVTALRLVALERGVPIAANRLGKAKTGSQVVAVSLLIFSAELGQWIAAGHGRAVGRDRPDHVSRWSSTSGRNRDVVAGAEAGSEGRPASAPAAARSGSLRLPLARCRGGRRAVLVCGRRSARATPAPRRDRHPVPGAARQPGGRRVHHDRRALRLGRHAAGRRPPRSRPRLRELPRFRRRPGAFDAREWDSDRLGRVPGRGPGGGAPVPLLDRATLFLDRRLEVLVCSTVGADLASRPDGLSGPQLFAPQGMVTKELLRVDPFGLLPRILERVRFGGVGVQIDPATGCLIDREPDHDADVGQAGCGPPRTWSSTASWRTGFRSGSSERRRPGARRGLGRTRRRRWSSPAGTWSRSTTAELIPAMT